MPLLDSALKLGGKALTLGGKVFGLGKGKLSFRDKKLAGMGWSKTVKGNPWGATGQLAAKIAAVGGGTNLLQNAIGDAGPEGDEFQERAYNQLRYGVDMTDAQMEEAIGKGQTFQDTGIIGEGGLNEEQVLKYLEQESQDKRGGLEKAASAGLSTLAMVPGLGTILGTPAEMLYDKAIGDTRRQGLKNAVENLKLDANTVKMRKDMENKHGKFMAEGLLGKDFGTGNVTGINRAGIKPPVDRQAQAEQAAAEKEYEAIKARDGVHAALGHPSALKAGRVVYQDVLEASGGDKNTAEALLSGVGGQEGVGLTDQATMERYYGNAKENALANRATSAEAMLASERSNAAMAKAAAAEQTRRESTSGPIEVSPATTAEQVRNNQALINAQGGFHGESPIAAEQRAYLEENGMMTARGANRALNAAGNAMYEKAYKQAPGSPEATADAFARLYRNIDAGRQQYQQNRARLADIEYADKIVKPGDAGYALGAKPRTQEAQDEYMAATELGGGAAPAQTPSVPAQVNASAAVPQAPVAAPSRAAILTQGRPATPVAPVAPVAPPGAPAPLNFKPTPYGLGTATPGIPQLPDIGAPGRAIGGAVGNAIFSQNGTGVPLPGGANLKAPVMGMSPYGIGNSTPGSRGIPQVPDIGAPARAAGESVGNLLFSQNRPGVELTDAQRGIPPKPSIPAYDMKGNIVDPKIAQIISEQKRKEIEARNRANPNPNRTQFPRPDPLRRFF